MMGSHPRKNVRGFRPFSCLIVVQLNLLINSKLHFLQIHKKMMVHFLHFLQFK